MSPDSAVAPRSATSSAVVTVERISTWHEFKLLAKPWTQLAQQFAADNFFMSWEFAASWWQAYQDEHELFVLQCRNEQNDLVGIAPLYRESDDRFGLKSRTLRLIGDGSDDADGFGFLLRPNLEGAGVQSVLDWLAAHEAEWDVLRFGSMAEDSRLAQELLTGVQQRGWVQRAELAPHLSIELAPTWEAYMGSLSAKVRQTWMRKMRHAEDRFRVRLRRTESAAELDADLETVMQLHNKTWRARGTAGKLESPERRNFYVALANAAFQDGSLDLWLLELDGVPRAARLGFRAGKTRHAMLAGMDPAFAEYSPGTIAEAMVLKQCIERGDGFYDFLAGNEEYKLECGPSEQHYLDLTIARPRTRAGIHLAAQCSVHEAKGWVRTELPTAYRLFRKASISVRGTSSNRPALGAPKSARADSSDIHLKVFRDPGALQALYSDWNALLSRSTMDSIFLSLAWMTAWLEAYGSRELLTLAGFAPSGELIGIAPFYVSSWLKARRGSIRVLRILGDATHDAGSLGFISKKGSEEKFAGAIVDWLSSNRVDYDAIEMEHLAGAPLDAFLIAIKSCKWAIRERTSSHMVIDLPETFETFQRNLSPGLRKSLAAAAGRLSSREVKFHLCRSEEEVKIVLDQLFRLHSTRWQKKDMSGAFANLARQDFYRRLASSMLPCGKLDLWTMTVEGQTVAAEFGLIHAGTRTSLQAGFDSDYSRFNVGSLLDQEIIAAAIQGGIRSYDLLEGEQEYKQRWGALPKEYMSVRCAPPRSIGAAWVRLSGVKAAQSFWQRLKRSPLS